MLRKIPLALYITLLVFAFLSSLWLGTQSLTIAQAKTLPFQVTPTPQKAPEFPEGRPVEESEEMRQANLEMVATAHADFESRSIFDYRIAYLIAADTDPGNEVITAENMAETVGAEAVHTWEDFVTLNDEQPFQIILAHVSMLEAIDLEWMHHAYRQNVLVAGISVSREQMQALTGDFCLKEMNPHRKVSDFTGFLRVYIYSVYAVDESLYEAIHQAELIDCTGYDARGTTTGVIHGQTESELEEQWQMDQFAKLLISNTMNYDLPPSNDEKLHD